MFRTRWVIIIIRCILYKSACFSVNVCARLFELCMLQIAEKEQNVSNHDFVIDQVTIRHPV